MHSLTLNNALKAAFEVAVKKDLVVVYDEGLVNNAKIDIKAYTLTVHIISALLVLRFALGFRVRLRVRHICFFPKKNRTTLPKIFTGDHMTSRQFHRWKLVTTI